MNLVVSLLMLVMTSHLEVVRAQGVQCHVAAKVQGVFSGVDSATDYNDCLACVNVSVFESKPLIIQLVNMF